MKYVTLKKCSTNMFLNRRRAVPAMTEVKVQNQAGAPTSVLQLPDGTLDVEVHRVHERIDIRPDYFVLLAAPDIILGVYFQIEDAWYALQRLNETGRVPVMCWTYADFRRKIFGDYDCAEDTPLLEYWEAYGCDGLQL